MAVARWGVVAVVLSLALGAGFVAPAVPTAGAQPTRLDSCTTISEPGEYVLSSDIESRAETCLRVEADDVVLSGAGHSIDGGAFRENTTAVAVTGENVTVRNLSVLRWTFGIRYDSAEGGVVRDVTAWRTVDGVTFSSSTGASVERVTATNGVTGISFVESERGIVRNSVVRYQSSTGVLVADSERITISDTTVARTETGIALLGSREARVTGTVVRATGESSLLLADSRASRVVNATLSNPGREATVLLSNASENRIVADGDWTVNRTGKSGGASDYPPNA